MALSGRLRIALATAGVVGALGVSGGSALADPGTPELQIVEYAGIPQPGGDCPEKAGGSLAGDTR